MTMGERLRDYRGRHPRVVAAGVIGGALVLLVVAGGLAIAVFGPQPTAEASEPPAVLATPSFQPTDGASSTPSSIPSPTATPASTPLTSASTSFNLLPAEQPAAFVSQITCSGTIGASDPVAIVQLHAAVEGTGEIVLRDYADVGSPRTVCDFGGHGFDVRLIDARHGLITTSSAGRYTYAVVDLPEVRYHWFQLPVTPGWPSELIAVSPGLDQVVWKAVDPQGSSTDTVHVTTSTGDHVVATLRDTSMGRCGTPDDSKHGAYTRSGAHLFVLNQPITFQNSLLVLTGETTLMSIVPPSGDWPTGAHPAMAVWSPTSETLFYRLGGDVWKWTSGSGPELYLPGVTWYHPTISPDGSLLAYAVARPEGTLHDVFLVDLAHGGSPQQIGDGARKQPAFLNSSQLWFKSEGDDHGCAGATLERPLIYNITDGSESPSIIDQVLQVWPATSSNW